MSNTINEIVNRVLDGENSYEELAAMIKKFGLTEEELMEVFDEIEDRVPHCQFSNVDNLIALTA